MLLRASYGASAVAETTRQIESLELFVSEHSK